MLKDYKDPQMILSIQCLLIQGLLIQGLLISIEIQLMESPALIDAYRSSVIGR